MESGEIFGHVGALLSSATFVPQVYKTWKSKSAGDLSLVMLIIVLVSTLVWLVYAFTFMLWPVILANSFVCVLSIMLIYFKFNFK